MTLKRHSSFSSRKVIIPVMLCVAFILSLTTGCAAPAETPTPEATDEPAAEEQPPTETPLPPTPTPTAEPTETSTFTPVPPTETPPPTETTEPEGDGFCGDRICTADESEESCVADCTVSYPAACEGTFCGDGICQATCSETAETCPEDCASGGNQPASQPTAQPTTQPTDQPTVAAAAPTDAPPPTSTEPPAPPPAESGMVPFVVVNQGCEKQGVVIDGTALWTVDAGDTITIQVEIGGHTVQNCGGTNCSGEMWIEFEPPGVRLTIVPGDSCG